MQDRSLYGNDTENPNYLYCDRCVTTGRTAECNFRRIFNQSPSPLAVCEPCNRDGKGCRAVGWGAKAVVAARQRNNQTERSQRFKRDNGGREEVRRLGNELDQMKRQLSSSSQYGAQSTQVMGGLQPRQALSHAGQDPYMQQREHPMTALFSPHEQRTQGLPSQHKEMQELRKENEQYRRMLGQLTRREDAQGEYRPSLEPSEYVGPTIMAPIGRAQRPSSRYRSRSRSPEQRQQNPGRTRGYDMTPRDREEASGGLGRDIYAHSPRQDDISLRRQAAANVERNSPVQASRLPHPYDAARLPESNLLRSAGVMADFNEMPEARLSREHQAQRAPSQHLGGALRGAGIRMSRTSPMGDEYRAEIVEDDGGARGRR